MVTVPAPLAQNAVPVIPSNRTVDKLSEDRTDSVKAVRQNNQPDRTQQEPEARQAANRELGSVLDIRV